MTEDPIPDEREGVVSCSELPRIFGCEASIKYRPLKDVLDLGDDPQARDDGNIVHDLLKSPDPEMAEVEGATDDHRETAATMLKRFEALSDEFFDGEPCHWEELAEVRLWMTHRGVRILTGRMDRARFNEARSRMLLADWKSGYDPPEAEDNQQLFGYAVLCCNESLVIENVRTAIVHRWGADVQDYTRDEIEAGAEEMVDRLVRLENAPIEMLTHNPRPEFCRYCPGRAVCPVHPWSYAEARAVIEGHHDLTVPVRTLSAPQLVRLLDTVPRVEDFITALKAETKRRVKAGDPELEAAGFFLAGSGEIRQVARPGVMQQALLPEVSAEDFVSRCVKVTIGEAERLHKERTGLRGAKAQEDFERRTAQSIEMVAREPSLRRRKPKNDIS